MKVGDYVRIKTLSGQGRIAKLEKVDDICITDSGAVDKNNIIKSSPNIIDLIEEGDYVNGFKVAEVLKDSCGYRGTDDYIYDCGDIKSIVTKEQMEEMEYKIND